MFRIIDAAGTRWGSYASQADADEFAQKLRLANVSGVTIIPPV